jgi:imidazolonepropionase-like amidohydrolase
VLAWALSLDGRGPDIGSLEIGKQADFAIHDCGDYREIAYFFGVPSVKAVYIGGRLAWGGRLARAGSMGVRP